MREILKGLTEKDYWVYGIKDSDFDHVIFLVWEMIEARSIQYNAYAAEIKIENPDDADDILDDVAYYRHTDEQYLWQFALWRLQGLIEAIISQELQKHSHTSKVFGLDSRLKALKSYGYVIEKNELDELLLWASLRNAISHAPPEQYRPVPILEEDILEYYTLIKDLCLRWQKIKTNCTSSLIPA